MIHLAPLLDPVDLLQPPTIIAFKPYIIVRASRFNTRSVYGLQEYLPQSRVLCANAGNEAIVLLILPEIQGTISIVLFEYV